MQGIINIFRVGVLFYLCSVTLSSQIPDVDLLPVPKVLDGDDIAGPEKYPYFTRIYSSSHSEIHCCGILISPTKILSAAHCFFNETGEFIAILGCNAPFSPQLLDDTTGPCHIHRNLSAKIHAQYPITYQNDVAIIDLSGPEPLFDTVSDKNVDLNGSWIDASALSPSKANCFALGWGCMDPDDPESCGVQKVDLNMVDFMANCAASSSYNGTKNWNTTIELCALSPPGSWGSRLCLGDSGAGLFCPSGDETGKNGRFVLEGVLSAGDRDCDGTVPKVFTNLRPYKSWMGGDNLDRKSADDKDGTGRWSCAIWILIICTCIVVVVLVIVTSYWAIGRRNARSTRDTRNTANQMVPLTVMRK